MPSKDQDGLFGEVLRDLVGSDRWDRYYATGGVVPPPLPPPPRRTIREGFSPLQAIANLARTSKLWLKSVMGTTDPHELDVAFRASRESRLAREAETTRMSAEDAAKAMVQMANLAVPRTPDTNVEEESDKEVASRPAIRIVRFRKE